VIARPTGTGTNKEVTMTDCDHTELQTRRARLAAIAAEYAEHIFDLRSALELVGGELVERFAAVTAAGCSEPGFPGNGNLLVAETTAELAEQLRRECEDCRLAYGRVWDLDEPFQPWGNLDVCYSVRVGEDGGRPIHIVRVEGREEGIYLFEDVVDAEAFQEAAGSRGGEAELCECPLHDIYAAYRLIVAERER
jgi:hypothetical protein